MNFPALQLEVHTNQNESSKHSPEMQQLAMEIKNCINLNNLVLQAFWGNCNAGKIMFSENSNFRLFTQVETCKYNETMPTCKNFIF